MKAFTKKRGGLALLVAILIAGGWVTYMYAVDPRDVFELEGDIFDSPVGGLNDWENLLCSSPPSPSTAAVNTGVISDPAPLSIFFQGGSKDKLDINNWKFKDGAVPDKDDVTNAYAAQYVASGATVLVVGGDRISNDGSANIGAWFFQNAIGLGPTTNGTGDFTGVHKNGDIFILAEFTIGGTVSTLKVFEWVGSAGPCPNGPCPAPTEKGDTLADITPPGVATAIGFANSADQTIPCSADWPYTPKQGTPGTMPPNAFFEVGIDVSALNLGNVCFASFLVETRSSHDVDAQLKDFVLHSFAPCVCNTSKAVAPSEVCEGASATYTWTVSNPEGSADLTITAVDDIEGNVCMPATSGDPCTFSASACPFTLAGGAEKSCTLTVTRTAGSYTNHFTATGSPTGGTLAIECSDSEATLNVNATPAVNINQLDCNANSVSQGASFTLTATPSGGTPGYNFLWSPGGETSSSITKTAVGTYSVAITDTKGCSANATRKVGYCSN